MDVFKYRNYIQPIGNYHNKILDSYADDNLHCVSIPAFKGVRFSIVISIAIWNMYIYRVYSPKWQNTNPSMRVWSHTQIWVWIAFATIFSEQVPKHWQFAPVPLTCTFLRLSWDFFSRIYTPKILNSLDTRTKKYWTRFNLRFLWDFLNC